MKRLLIVCIGAACAYALAAVTNFPALAQGDSAPNSYVKLQTATPGIAQTGHANITGTNIAGEFQGGGAGLTSVNADLLDGLNSTAFLQAIPIPLTLSGTSSSPIIRGENASTSPGSAGIYGLSTSSTGLTYGVYGQTFSGSGRGVFGLASSGSTSGAGVFGEANAGTGFTYGVYGVDFSTSGRGVFGWAEVGSGDAYGVHGRSDSVSGRGVFGEATATSGTAYGVYGKTTSNSGNSAGVFGLATGPNGTLYGVLGESDGTNGIGVFGSAGAVTGNTYGGYFQSASTAGIAVFGWSSANTGSTSGGYFHSSSMIGQGVYGEAGALTGINYGVHGQSDSTSGRGVFGEATATTGATFGGRFQSDGTSGTGVYGLAFATSGTSYGVSGRSESASGFGALFENGGLGISHSVEVSGPNGAINTSDFVYREYTASTRSAAIPIAYGSIAADGTISGGTGNFSVVHTVGSGAYDVTVVGETYSNNMTVSITPVSNNPRIANVADAGAGFRVNMWNLSSALIDAPFQFTLWAANPAEPGDNGYQEAPENNGGTGKKTFKRPDAESGRPKSQ